MKYLSFMTTYVYKNRRDDVKYFTAIKIIIIHSVIHRNINRSAIHGSLKLKVKTGTEYGLSHRIRIVLKLWVDLNLKLKGACSRSATLILSKLK